MNIDAKILVVGTTTDYIDWLRQANPQRCLFVTDMLQRHESVEPEPQAAEELLCDLSDFIQVKNELLKHLARWHMSLDGIVCYDCESMELAAFLAQELALAYPSVQSIQQCRDKYLTKSIWRRYGVPCPQTQLVQTADAVYDFLREIDAPCVLKPVSGSGSELVFRCTSRKECAKGVQLMLAGLRARKECLLYSNTTSWFLVEECVKGDEYSCDFTVSGDKVEIIRLTRKIKDPRRPFGTITAYQLADFTGPEPDRRALEEILAKAAAALGITRAICMVDFLINDGKIVLLEMSPRPGGDCIPILLKHSGYFDILSFALDFAQQRQVQMPCWQNGKYAAMRLHAHKEGTIKTIDLQPLTRDARVIEINSIRKAGHRISMPPRDYDSWYMGHVVFNPAAEIPMAQQCRELHKLFVLEMENDS